MLGIEDGRRAAWVNVGHFVMTFLKVLRSLSDAAFFSLELMTTSIEVTGTLDYNKL